MMRLMNICALALLLTISLLPTMEADAQGSAMPDYATLKAIYDNRTGPYTIVGASVMAMHQAVINQALEYAVSANEGATNYTFRHNGMSNSKVKCRALGYLDHCSHPFVEFNGSTSNNDIEYPLEVDYVVSNDYITSPKKPKDLKHFPLFIMGVTPIFNIEGIQKLVVTREVLAKMFRTCSTADSVLCKPGSIDMWNDPAIKATNPVWTHPILDTAGPIRLITRSDSAGSTSTLKKLLGSYEEAFADQVGQSPANSWPGVNVFASRRTTEGQTQSVKVTTSALGYVTASMAYDNDIGILALTDGNHIVESNHEGLSAAMDDVGLKFAADGVDDTDYTVDLTGSEGSRAWPITSIMYFVTRTERTGGDCFARSSTILDFLEHALVGSGTAGMSNVPEGLSLLNADHGAEVLHIARTLFKCDGNVVYQFPPEPAKVVVYADPTLHESLKIFSETFEKRNSGTVAVDIRTVLPHPELMSRFLEEKDTGYIVIGDDNLSSDLSNSDKTRAKQRLMSLPFASSGTAFVYNWCSPEDVNCQLNEIGLNLDINTAAMILDGDITWWNDSRIYALNPIGIVPHEKIKVYAGPQNNDFFFNVVDFIRRNIHADFAFLAPGIIHDDSFKSVATSISTTAYSFAVVPYNGTLGDRVMLSNLVPRGGSGTSKTIVPGTPALEACAKDTYDPKTNSFLLAQSSNPDCYPLLTQFRIFIKNEFQSDSTTYQRAATAATRFADFVFRKSSRTVKTASTVLSTSNYGSYMDFKDSKANIDLTFTVREALNSILLNGVSILIVPQDMRWIPFSLTALMYALAALEVMCYLALGFWVFSNRNRKLIRNSSPTFMMQVLLGCILMTLTIIPLAYQDDFVKPYAVPADELNPGHESLNIACISQPILFSMGFFIAFSALFLKSWRLIRIFDNKKLRNLFLRDRQLLVYQSLILLIIVILNLIWALQSPMTWTRFPNFIDTANQMVVDSSGLCHSPDGIYPAIPLIIGIILTLGIGNYLAYMGRRIPTEFNESKWTAMAMVVALEAMTMGVPVLILANNQPVAGFIVKAIICLLVSGATVSLIFLPKVAMAYGIGVVDGESNPWRFVKGGSSGSNNHSKDTGKQNAQEKGSKQRFDIVNPSFHSGKVAATDNGNSSTSSKPNPFMIMVHKNKIGAGDTPAPSTTNQLKSILDSDPTRRRFRRYLQTLKMDENVRFWDSVLVNRTEPNFDRRSASARAIIQTFVLDSAPLQVNLSSGIRQEILKAFEENDKAKLASENFFQAATDELFNDMRQSDAFRMFLEQDTFSAVNLSKSDTAV